MNWCDNDKHHLPHFHAYYNEFEASFDFDGEIIAGSFPARQTAFVKPWTLLHQDGLNANWKLAIEGELILKNKFNNKETRYFDGKKIYNLNFFKLLQYVVRNLKQRKRVKSEGKFQNSGLT